ncbi:MAG TPA: hypothetical protein VJI66_01195 [Candidatus Paceibacterota bacterium]
MNKTILTIILLIIALVAVYRLRDFINKNKPTPVIPNPDEQVVTSTASTTINLEIN